MAGATIIGSDPTVAYPIPYAPPTIERKAKWTDDWQFDPELEVVSFGVHASSHDVDSAEILRRYGNTKYPYELGYKLRTASNLTGDWIRISIIGEQGPVVQFVGFIEAPTRTLKGSVAVAAGDQAWVAVGGLRFLQKQMISQSYFLLASGSLSLIGWIPEMNAKDKRNEIVGNRSDNPITTAGHTFYCYGGKSIWTHRQYVDYLIANFLQQYDDTGAPTGPVWSLGGQVSILDGMQSSIKFSQAITAAQMLGHLIPPRYGIDYFVKPTDAGFEITVFALSADTQSVVTSDSSVAMPKNPNTITITKDDQIDLVEVKLVESGQKRFDQIYVLGKRIVVCGTLYGNRVYNGSYIQSTANASLIAKWSPAIETDYQTAAGMALVPSMSAYVVSPTSDPEINDKIRAGEKYRNVYQLLGAPSDWDLEKGAFAVLSNDDGSLTTAKTLQSQAQQKDPNATVPNYAQVSIRETLPWLPLKEGFDYSTNPPTDNTLGDGIGQQLKPPMAMILNEHPETSTTPMYEWCNKVGISVHAPNNEWGIFLNASPNHLLARNHWLLEPADASGVNLNTTNLDELKYDYTTVIATVAIESDHRLHLGYTVPPNLAAGDGSVMTILDEEAECWVLLPGTVVGLDANNMYQFCPQQSLFTLRSDVDRLALIMAGAISRYKNDRVRALLTINSHVAYAFMLGQILDVIQDGDDLNKVGGPITSVEWLTGAQPKTIIRTGYA